MSSDGDIFIPAFPVIADNGLGHISSGMDLRDFFAAHAMAQLWQISTAEAKAQVAYEIADAMLKARQP